MSGCCPITTRPPDLQRRFDEYRERTGYTPPRSAFANIPTSGVPEPRSDVFWKQFYDGPIKEGTAFDIYGVACEPGRADCMHMLHPLERMTELEGPVITEDGTEAPKSRMCCFAILFL